MILLAMNVCDLKIKILLSTNAQIKDLETLRNKASKLILIRKNMWKSTLNRSHHLRLGHKGNHTWPLWKDRPASPVELQDTLLAIVWITFAIANNLSAHLLVLHLRNAVQKLWIKSRLRLLLQRRGWLRLHTRKLVLIMIGMLPKQRGRQKLIENILFILLELNRIHFLIS